MRHTNYIVAAVLVLALTLCLTPKSAYAAGDVLLPSDDQDSPNLGLAPTKPGKSTVDTLFPSTTDTTATSPATAVASPTSPYAPPVDPATINDSLNKAIEQLKSAPSIPNSPDGLTSVNTSGLVSTPQSLTRQQIQAIIDAPVRTTPMTAADIMYSPVSDAEAAQLPLGVMRTTVIKIPDMSSIYAMAGASLPYSMTLQIGPKSVYGADDVSTIEDKLGMTRDDISKSCVLTLSGLLQTDKASYMIISAATPQATVKYDGMIKNYLMTGVAKCSYTGKLPPGSGILNQVGDRFNISLGLVKCDPPTRQSSLLTITYDGTPNPKCEYQ